MSVGDGYGGLPSKGTCVLPPAILEQSSSRPQAQCTRQVSQTRSDIAAADGVSGGRGPERSQGGQGGGRIIIHSHTRVGTGI